MILSLSAKLYISLIALAAFLMVIYFLSKLYQVWDLYFALALIIFSILIFLAEYSEVELVYNKTMSTGIAICLAAIF